METTEKTCRYGHGLLQRSPETWAVPQMHITPKTFSNDGSLINPNTVWTCSLLFCKKCGYMELEDKEVTSGNSA